MATGSGPLRIGAFGRRVGVTPELLRAWERRYGLLRPVRSPGGFRLYTDEDAERVAGMRRALDDGLSAAEAARAALERGQPSGGLLEGATARLLAAIKRYDEDAVHTVLDKSLVAFGLEAVLHGVILPTSQGSRAQLAGGYARGQPGALRQQPHPRPAARARAALEPWRRAARAARLRPRGSTRHHSARLRPAPALARLADPVPRRRHADLDTDTNR